MRIRVTDGATTPANNLSSLTSFDNYLLASPTADNINLYQLNNGNYYNTTTGVQYAGVKPYTPVIQIDAIKARNSGEYVVQKVNVLGDIAAKLGTTIEILVQLNKIPESKITRDSNGIITNVLINIGQELILPPSNVSLNDLMEFENEVNNINESIGISDPLLLELSQAVSSFLVNENLTNTQPVPDTIDYSNPIGAFYEDVAPTVDNATAIAHKTPVILGTNNLSLTASQLTALDSNHDGQLSGSELTDLNLWADLGGARVRW